MPKITDKELEPIQVRLFKEDLDYLRELYAGNLGVAKVIRTIVHSFVTNTRAKANTIIDANDTFAGDVSLADALVANIIEEQANV